MRSAQPKNSRPAQYGGKIPGTCTTAPPRLACGGKGCDRGSQGPLGEHEQHGRRGEPTTSPSSRRLRGHRRYNLRHTPASGHTLCRKDPPAPIS
jgi:hypothetical protein